MAANWLAQLSKSELAALRKRETFDLLKDVGLAIQSLLGRSCEVVLHDVSDLEHSIIWVAGDVTGRRVGGMMTDLGLEMLRKGDTHPLFNYTTYTESGKALKSCSIWLRDSAGEVYGAFCINLDVTPIVAMQVLMQDLAPKPGSAQISESHPQDLNDILDAEIAEAEYRLGKAAKDMAKNDRIRLVRFLDERGIFQVRNSVAIVASRLGVTRKTIYNYLNISGAPAPDGAKGPTEEGER